MAPVPAWDRFAALVGLLVALFVGLARLSQGPVDDEAPPLGHAEAVVNVLFSQGLFAGLAVFAVWYSQVPAAALGLGPADLHLEAAALGVGLGLVLALGNELAQRFAERAGADVGAAESLRELLAPATPAGWALLLLVVLPLVAGFEELLFRGALVSGLAAGYGLSPWVLAAGSSVLFGLGHGAQGRLGVLLAGVFGFALAAALVLTGSLVVPLVAHYLVNALSFLIHEA
jgi:membrane protease YdiL (CAAX protease family)